jgi:hypothetical protein
MGGSYVDSEKYVMAHSFNYELIYGFGVLAFSYEFRDTRSHA